MAEDGSWDGHCHLWNLSVVQNASHSQLWEELLAVEGAETMYKIPTFVLLALLMAVGVPGNLLVLLVYGFRFPASTTKNFILAMAAFDLLNSLLGMPFEMIDLNNDMTLDIPVACKIMRFVVSLNAYGSVTVLVVVSVDRFRRICKPFRKQMTVSMSRNIIAGMVLVSVVMSSPALVLYGRQTTNRHGLILYECTIDDRYKNTTGAGFYQFVLMSMFVIGIVTLVVMYSFIIYKIRKQRQRRQKLSNQSMAMLTAVRTAQALTNVVVSNSTQPELHNHNGQLDTQQEVVVNSNDVELTSDQLTSKSGKMEVGSCRKQPSLRSVRRLFSRDVNPIFEENADNDEIDDVTLGGEDVISLLDNYQRSQSVDTAWASLNNYLANSLDTQLSTAAVTVKLSSVQPEEITQTGTETVLEATPTRSRKLGHFMGRYRPWESEEVLRQMSVVSVADREWFSHSCSAIDSDTEAIQKPAFNIRRASSLPCLLPGGLGGGAAGKGMVGTPGRACNGVSKSRDHSRPSVVSTGQLGNVQESSSSCDSVTVAEMASAEAQDKQPVANANNVTWESIDPGQLSPVAGLPTPAFRTEETSRSASVATTLTQAYKRKAYTREIKTSKVSFMMLVVTLGFVLSYLPHLAIQAFKTVSPLSVAQLLCHSPTYFAVHHFCMRSFFFNNAINPIIYSFYNKTFRKRCLRLLKSPRSLFVSSEQQGHSYSQSNDTN